MALESKLNLIGGVTVPKAYYVCTGFATKNYINKFPAATSGTITIDPARETKTHITTINMNVYKDAAERETGVPVHSEKCEVGAWVPVGLTYDQVMNSCYDKWCEQKDVENVEV